MKDSNPFRRLEVINLTTSQRLSSISNNAVKKEITDLIGKMNDEVSNAKKKLDSQKARDLAGSPAAEKYREKVISEMESNVDRLFSEANFTARTSNLQAALAPKPSVKTDTEILIENQKHKEIRDDIRANKVGRYELERLFRKDVESGRWSALCAALEKWPGAWRPLDETTIQKGKQLAAQAANPGVAADLSDLLTGIDCAEYFKNEIQRIT